MSSDGSTAGAPVGWLPLVRGRTGCGAWNTPTVPWPGLVTNSVS
jgi:hypothetical protein